MDYLKGRHNEEVEVKKLELKLMERKIILQTRAQDEDIALIKQEMVIKEQEIKHRQKDAAATEEKKLDYLA